MPKKLTNLFLRQIALVDQGANQEANIALMKRHTETVGTGAQKVELSMTDQEKAALEQQVADSAAALEKANAEIAKLKGEPVLTSDVETLRKEHAKATAELDGLRSEYAKQVEDANKSVEAHKTEIQKLRAAHRRQDFIKFCAELKDLPGAAADDNAELLDDIEKAVGRERFDRFAGRLRSWNAIVAKSKVFEEIGRSETGHAFGSAAGALDVLAKERAASKNITYQKAYDEVLTEHPELYHRYNAEKGA